MTNHKIELLVREMSNEKVVALYVRSDLELPFVPVIGMQFKQGTSTWLWEIDGGELMPKIEAVIYDLDKETLVCLFTVEKPLKSGFWTKIKGAGIEKSTYPAYYQARS
jgi:hypothetical protein